MNRLAPADRNEKAMYEMGRVDERAVLIARLQAKICFRFLEGECKHGACWGFSDMIQELKNK